MLRQICKIPVFCLLPALCVAGIALISADDFSPDNSIGYVSHSHHSAEQNTTSLTPPDEVSAPLKTFFPETVPLEVFYPNIVSEAPEGVVGKQIAHEETTAPVSLENISASVPNASEMSPKEPSAPESISSHPAITGDLPVLPLLPLATSASENTTDIAQELDRGAGAQGAEATPKGPVKTILINFNNVNAVEFIRFISRISNRNFIFDENDLQFQVTIVSEEPTTLENIMAALMQELRVHNLSLIEQGNNIIIHRNPGVNSISTVVADNLPPDESRKPEIVTRLFRLNTADSDKIATILKPLMSEQAIVEVFKDTNHLIVTDIVTNVNEVALLVKSLDSPNNGLVIGQFVVRNGFIDSMIQLVQKIMQPISQDQTLIFVPHRAASSIFIVSTPFMMERTIALLQYLDQDQGATRIFDLKDLKFSDLLQRPVGTGAEGQAGGPGGPGGAGALDRAGQWVLDENGNWVYRPYQEAGVAAGANPPQGSWFVDENGNWRFRVGAAPSGPVGPAGVSGPEGYWRLDPQGFWVFQLAQGKSISPEQLGRARRRTADLPLGNIERTQFFIYKLQYRRGDQIANAIGRIGFSLRQTPGNNIDLAETIDSVQWIESSNSLIFTGTVEALDKVNELVREIDTPLRQVFIEMLILETTLDDSLTYGVDWGSRFGGGGFAGAQSYLFPGSPLPIGLATTGIGLVPDATALSLTPGYSLGIVGHHLTMGGLRFNSIGALVRAVHDRASVHIVTNPKILTEDNVPAEIFVGINTPFPTQAIANDRGEIITQNFEFRDVGTQLRVTPLIGDNDIITLIIEEEISSIAATPPGAINNGPTTRKSFTRTRVHIPNEFFLVMSGMMQDEDDHTRTQVPCLGGLPFIGGGFSNQVHRDFRRNIMIFLRPKIIDTEEDIQNVTRHQQDVWKYKKKIRPMWEYEIDGAMDFFNLPDPCEEDCDECCKFQNR